MKPDFELPLAVELDLPSFVKIFGALDDPRIDRTKKYSLGDIIGLTLIAMICGADNWAEISRFGHERLEWLRNFIPLSLGSPSHDTIARVFAINERQYHISSLSNPPAILAAATIRGHWSVENKLHWQLDVSFGEDSCLAANRNAAQNLSSVRKAALKMLNSVKKEFKSGVKSLRKMAGWNIKTAEAVLIGVRT